MPPKIPISRLGKTVLSTIIYRNPFLSRCLRNSAIIDPVERVFIYFYARPTRSSSLQISFYNQRIVNISIVRQIGATLLTSPRHLFV
jgi:hypothetical protein